MRILLISSAYNSMTQRVHVELADCGHEVSVELALGDEVMRDAVRRFDPDLVIAPMLTTAIPADIWSARPCFIIHPGPRGDRGPSSLDWAIMGGAGRWGVTVLQANAEMDAGDMVEAILTTTDRLTVAALAGNAAAGGLMLALAADEVWCRAGAVLNPHYRLMGLHGSEYWTYTLPRRVGAEQAARLTEKCLPVSPASALQCGLVDRVIESGTAAYRAQVAALAEKLARSPDYPRRLAAKARQLTAAAITQPLESYRRAELAIMSRNFSGPGEPYAQLRRAFVYKHKPTRTPPHLSRHRTDPGQSRPGRSRKQETISVLDRPSGPSGNAASGSIEVAANNR